MKCMSNYTTTKLPKCSDKKILPIRFGHAWVTMQRCWHGRGWNFNTVPIHWMSLWNVSIRARRTPSRRPFPASFREKHSALAHFGDTPVTTNLPAWFNRYNARQTIEAGIKETKQVFHLNRLKVRSEPAIYLQEALTIFAANFIRWATAWIEHHALPSQNSLPLSQMGVKKQVQVAAHTSATVIHHSGGMLLTFSPASAFAGKFLFFPAPSRSLWRICFLPLFTFLSLIAQKLR